MSAPAAASARLALPQPYDVRWAQWYLSAHTVPGVERYHDGRYARTLSLSRGPALLTLHVDEDAVEVGVSGGAGADRAGTDLAEAVAVVRRLLDLDTDGGAVDAALARDPAIAASVSVAPGLRVPGTVDGWELLVRTMVGQQISLAAARTHLGRLVAALGEPVTRLTDDPWCAAGPDAGVPAVPWRLFPSAQAVASGGLEVLSGPRRRVASVVSAAATVAGGGLDLSPGRDPVALRADLLALPGVGPWTADYVVMRLAPQPDILLVGDLVVQQGARLLGLAPADLARPDRWAPYRSYATMHLWRVALAARGAARGARGRSGAARSRSAAVPSPAVSSR